MAAAERPEHVNEQLVTEALHRAFGGPVPAAHLRAGRDAVRAAAAIASQEAAADRAVVAEALEGAFVAPLDAETHRRGLVALRGAAATVSPLHLRVARRVGRHAVAAAIAVATLGSTSGVAAASSSALPGEALYPVKRVVERAMLTAAFTTGAEARVQTRLAERRLREVEMLLAQGASAEEVEPLLTEYDEHVAAAVQLDEPEVAGQVAVLEEQAEDLREQAAPPREAVVVEPTAPRRPRDDDGKPAGNSKPAESSGDDGTGGHAVPPAPAPPPAVATEQPNPEPAPQQPEPAPDPTATAAPDPTDPPDAGVTPGPTPTATPTPAPTPTEAPTEVHPQPQPGNPTPGDPGGPRRADGAEEPTATPSPGTDEAAAPQLQQE